MPKEKFKTVYVCTSCGEASPRWMGRCPSCGEWNTMVEDIVKETKGKGVSAPATGNAAIIASRLKDISTTEEHSRIITGISELDRVLGGGIVLGSVVLLGGEPGAGKSTLLLPSIRKRFPDIFAHRMFLSPVIFWNSNTENGACRRPMQKWHAAKWHGSS